MKYAIIGTGAVGGYYGAKLAHAENDVHFLLHNDYDYVREHGLQVDSCDGSFHLERPNIYRSTTEMPKVDVEALTAAHPGALCRARHQPL